MDPKELLGKTFTCECGRSHHVPTEKLVYAEDALAQLPRILGTLVNGRIIVLVADERTWDIAGQTAEKELKQAGWFVHHIIVPDAKSGEGVPPLRPEAVPASNKGGTPSPRSRSPVCDDVTHNWLKKQLAPGDIALAVGSGVINDLTKWSAFENDLPYAVVATAASMNGFTAANVAPAIEGVKTLVPARPPVAVFAVPSILIGAPFELTAAGLGDAIAKPMSTTDWLLNHIYCEEYFCPYSSRIINDLEPYYLDCPEDILKREPAAVDALFHALLYSGIAMTIVGTSAPASGGEHLLSHTLDMMSSNDDIAHDLHGRQVGVGAIFASALYERIFGIDKPEFHPMPSGIDAAFWGRRAGSVREQYKQKLPSIRIIGRKLQSAETWRTFIQAAKEQVRPPSQIKQCLKDAGAAHTFEDIGCSRQRILDAARHMHEIRKRPTVVDLAWMLGILPDAADEIIDTWLAG